MAGIRNKAKKSAINTDRLLQKLVDSIPDMVYFKDSENRFILVNKAHAACLGHKPREVVGKSDLDFFPLDIAEKYHKDDARVRDTGESIIGKIEKAERSGGGVTYVSTTKVPHYDELGNIIGIIGITRNVTDKMVAQEELSTYKDKLEELVRERTKALEESKERLLRMYNVKSDFTSMVSHELRTPLTIIKDGVDLVIKGLYGELNKKQEHSLKLVERNIDRLNKLINDILDFSRLESKKMKFRIVKADLNALIRSIAESYRHSLQNRKLKLVLKLDPFLPLAEFDPDRLAQVLYNLMSNALKYTEKGRITVKTKRCKGHIDVSIEDTGCGIKKEDLARVFEKFERLTDGVRARGTGLGLAICKQIIESLGGRISVKSEYQKGSDFYFTLPLKQAKQN